MATNDYFARLVDGVLYWRNGVLPFYWGGTYHPGDFEHRTSGSFQNALVWLEARGYQLLAERMQRAYRDLIALVDDLDARYQAHPAPGDATESEVIKRELLLPCYDKTIAFVELLEDISKATTSEFPSAGQCVPADEQQQLRCNGSPAPQVAAPRDRPSAPACEAQATPEQASASSGAGRTEAPPASADPKPAAAPAVQLGRPGEPCIVLGKRKKPLTDGQYAVASALLQAGKEGLNKDAMEAIRPSARRILKRLREDADWAEVVLLPGQTNGRYRIRG